MPEKLPPLERPEPEVFGSASKEKQEAAKISIMQRFGEKHLEQISKEAAAALATIDRPKQPFEQEAIKTANAITNNLLEKFGLPQFDVPERNLHVIPDKNYATILDAAGSSAITIQDRQTIILNAEKLTDPLVKASAIFHEIIHLKNFLRLEVTKDFHLIHRSGLRIEANEKKIKDIGDYSAFSGLNEAIVAEIEKRHFPELIASNPFLKSEWEAFNSKKSNRIKEKILREKSVTQDELLWINNSDGSYSTFSYYEQRKVLNYVVQEIYEDHKDRFDSKDAVMTEFFTAHFNGQISQIARLVGNVFGKEAFRILSMMDVPENSARLVMAYLKKHRQEKTAP